MLIGPGIMKYHHRDLAFTFVLLFVSCSGWAADIPFFVLDNGVGRGSWTPEQQAQTVKELGYSGMSYNYTTPQAAAQWQQELQQRGLRLFGLYLGAVIDESEATRYPVGLRDTIRQLKGTDTFVWLTLRVRNRENKGKPESNDACVKIVNQVADWAQASGVRVAIYPHAGFYVATADEAVRIVKQVNRPDVGLTVNLCHELMQGNAQRLPEIVRLAAPHLFLATINGADNDGKPGGYIQRLDRGSYDVYGFLKLLRTNGYRGPIGLQCYRVQGDIRENLEKSIRAWQGLMPTVSRPRACDRFSGGVASGFCCLVPRGLLD